MSVGFDPNSDFETITDGLEAVTLKHRGGPSEAIAAALQREITTAEVEASNGKYLKGDVRWHLPAAQVDRKPKPGDRIVDGNPRYYTILDVGHATLENRWRCISRDLEIAYGLDTYVDLQRATYVKADGGEAVPTWKTIATGLRAKVQPVEHIVEVEHDADETELAYNVFLEKSLPEAMVAAVAANHRVRDAEGNTYRIERYRQPERIDALPVLECQKDE